MKDMNIAVDRISSAINKNEKILVYGDYDVDGTTAVAMMYSFLKEQIFKCRLLYSRQIQGRLWCLF